MIDAIRFGTAVHDPRLVEPLLALTAGRARQRVRMCVLAYVLAAVWTVFVASRIAGVGHAADAVALTALAGLLLLFAGFLPNLGRAVRRNNEAAQAANRPESRLVDALASGSRWHAPPGRG